ncbi:MAG: aspartate--tRNA ligase [Patescibacteria group bacterium]|nr:aspartate--tRNA ligase [Patescibacteria group bacterium]MDE2116795.1 aspartate--tRNA ligase [Patescibacteria group bacterium]
MERTYIKDLESKKGQPVVIKGWIDIRRDQGKLIFLDIRDMTGYVQGVVLPAKTDVAKAVMETASKVRPEWVVAIEGKVNPRPEKNIQKDKQNGSIELEITGITVLNEAATPPIDVRSDGREIGEEPRLTYRYLDLRRPRLQTNMRSRHTLNLFIRNWLTKESFTEIETPILTKATPEGARDFLVPSRIEPGRFYALPQSPQQYKQLLMVSGFEKYFQLARCMRDEDTRGDRQPEFTQLDLEMSFVAREDVMALNERLLIDLVKTLYPHKKIQQIPFPRFTYKEAMEKYQSDKPDIRTDKNDPDLLAFCWVIDFPFFEKTDKGGWTFTHNPFSAPKPEHMDWLMKGEKIGDILTTQYDVALNGFEIGGGSIRNHRPEALSKVLEIMGHSPEKIRTNFGHMLDALGYGAPPHGGIAWGLDRLMAILRNEPNIREVIAFAKTGEGRDLMMQSPAEAEPERLIELGITVKKK